MKKLGEKGFHLWMIALIVVILAGLGFTGWYVWDKNKNQTVEEDQTSLATVSDSDPTPTPTPLFDLNLDDYSTKTLVGTNNNYDIYVLGIPNNLIVEGNVLVYSKAQNKALIINTSISVFSNGVNTTLAQQDGDYLVLDSGTGTTRGKHIILLQDKSIISLSYIKGYELLYWQDHYFYTLGDDTYQTRPAGDCLSLSIGYVNLLTKQTSVLVQSQPFIDYSATSISGNTLNYNEINYGNEANLNSAISTTTPKTYDLTTVE